MCLFEITEVLKNENIAKIESLYILTIWMVFFFCLIYEAVILSHSCAHGGPGFSQLYQQFVKERQAGLSWYKSSGRSYFEKH